VASIDPRLADPVLLALAAKRCQAKQQAPDWRTTVGLSALLDAAKHLPRRDPWDLTPVDTTSAMGTLLAEARQWEKEQPHGA
jgi:hypothetical protein